TISPGTGGSLTIGTDGIDLQTLAPATATISAPIALGASQTWNVADNSQTLSVSGVVSGAFNLTKTGAGVLALTGANTYTGTTTISEGTISVNKIAVSGGNSSLGNASSVVVLGGASTAGTLSYTGGADTYVRGFTVNAGGGGVISAATST